MIDLISLILPMLERSSIVLTVIQKISKVKEKDCVAVMEKINN